MKTRVIVLALGAFSLAGAALAQPAPPTQSAPAAPTPAHEAMSPPVIGKGDTVETLTADGRFKILVKGLTDTNLAGFLKGSPNITLFAPSDAAFNALPADQLTQLTTTPAAMQQMLILHMVNAKVESDAIEGTKGPVPSVGGKPILLDGSDETLLQAGGANIIQADIKSGAAVMHVIDKVMVADTTPPAAQ